MTDEELRQLAEECKTLGDELVPGGEWIDFASFRLVQASAAILSLMSERDEANARALNWECRFEAASARGAAAEARIRELSLSELTALGQADENHKRALDAEARLGRAVEALRAAKGAIDAAEIVGARNAAGYLTDRALWAQCAIDKINHALSDLEVKDDNG